MFKANWLELFSCLFSIQEFYKMLAGRMVQLQIENNILHFQDTLDSFQTIYTKNGWTPKSFIYFIKIIIAFFSIFLFQTLYFKKVVWGFFSTKAEEQTIFTLWLKELWWDQSRYFFLPQHQLALFWMIQLNGSE